MTGRVLQEGQRTVAGRSLAQQRDIDIRKWRDLGLLPPNPGEEVSDALFDALARQMTSQRHLFEIVLILRASGYRLPDPAVAAALDWLRTESDAAGEQVATRHGPGMEKAITKPSSVLLALPEIRSRVMSHLRSQGFEIVDGRITAPSPDKAGLRKLHAGAVKSQKTAAKAALSRHEDEFVARLACGDAIAPEAITPRLVEVQKDTPDGRLWRWCSLHWSIPVSRGYGRRLRFLVVDSAHDDKVIGLIGLADPVFALRPRDQWIGWTSEQRAQRLTCVMDAFALGAVPPYSGLLGGKLVALLAASTEVRLAFGRKYGHRKTIITGRDPKAQLVLVTTTSALGRSSVYNRLRWPDGTPALESVGYTKGSGDFHLSGEIYGDLFRVAAMSGPSTALHANWRVGSQSFRNRREVIQRAMRVLALDGEAMRQHGVQREVFLTPLAENSAAFLRGEDEEPRWRPHAAVHIGEWWRERWAEPRSAWDHSYKEFDPGSWRLWTGHAAKPPALEGQQ